ncbi:ATP-binding protein [Sporomusa ovata]|uniref:ATP-binding protein n=1 Tax=Sporomusa ovata TaxID=2378 RepID=UPI000685AAA2|nr:sensor histidine kinase [Sporomusa ovata]
MIQADAFWSGHNVIVEKGDTPDNDFDPNEVRQLLLNLLRNAMEAMPPNGQVRIKTYCNSDTIFLEVQDDGPGIPAEILQQLGKPFVTTKENGTGLGLPVCYRIAERHNAKLDIRSSPQGTTVCIKFKR